MPPDDDILVTKIPGYCTLEQTLILIPRLNSVPLKPGSTGTSNAHLLGKSLHVQFFAYSGATGNSYLDSWMQSRPMVKSALSRISRRGSAPMAVNVVGAVGLS